MHTLTAWAIRHGISQAAFNDLFIVLGAPLPTTPAVATPDQSEASVQQQVRLEAARRGVHLWRNNTGVAYDDRGVPVRFGLANDSAAMNKVCKFPDLVGITPIRCQCGHVWGVFTGYECKRPAWKFRQSDDRAVAQLNAIKLIIANGGIAKFITRVEEL